jgi:hypothetical protein
VARRPLRSLFISLAVALAACAPAQAATTLGSTAGDPNDNLTGGCLASGSNCTYFTTGGTPSLVVPSAGVIVAWRVNAGSAPVGNLTSLRVVRPAGGGTYTGAGRSTVETLAFGANSFGTRLRVQTGDIIGIDNDSEALLVDNTAAGFTATYFASALGEGATLAPSGTQSGKRLLVEADLEADLDGDGFGDETQDACPRASTDQTVPCDPDDIGGGGGGGGGGGDPPGIPPGPGGVLPPPATGKAVNVDTVSGTVLVKVPGSNRFVVLGTQERQIPTGSVIDTRKGRVSIVTAVGTASKATQQAVFYDGVFQFTQPRAARDAIAEAKLVGALENCSRRSGRGGAFDAAKRRGRRLWGNGRGRFRTRGRRSSTTVRGTVWLVEDRCDGTTLNRVTQGKVVVRDFGLRRNINLKAPGTYIARP